MKVEDKNGRARVVKVTTKTGKTSYLLQTPVEGVRFSAVHIDVAMWIASHSREVVAALAQAKAHRDQIPTLGSAKASKDPWQNIPDPDEVSKGKGQ